MKNQAKKPTQTNEKIAKQPAEQTTVEKPAEGEKPKETATSNAPKISKKQQMISLLKRSDGVTIAELEDVTGWKNPSVRGALVNLKNKEYSYVCEHSDRITSC